MFPSNASLTPEQLKEFNLIHEHSFNTYTVLEQLDEENAILVNRIILQELSGRYDIDRKRAEGVLNSIKDYFLHGEFARYAELSAEDDPVGTRELSTSVYVSAIATFITSFTFLKPNEALEFFETAFFQRIDSIVTYQMVHALSRLYIDALKYSPNYSQSLHALRIYLIENKKSCIQTGYPEFGSEPTNFLQYSYGNLYPVTVPDTFFMNSESNAGVSDYTWVPAQEELRKPFFQRKHGAYDEAFTISGMADYADYIAEKRSTIFSIRNSALSVLEKQFERGALHDELMPQLVDLICGKLSSEELEVLFNLYEDSLNEFNFQFQKYNNSNSGTEFTRIFDFEYMFDNNPRRKVFSGGLYDVLGHFASLSTEIHKKVADEIYDSAQRLKNMGYDSLIHVLFSPNFSQDYAALDNLMEFFKVYYDEFNRQMETALSEFQKEQGFTLFLKRNDYLKLMDSFLSIQSIVPVFRSPLLTSSVVTLPPTPTPDQEEKDANLYIFRRLPENKREITYKHAHIIMKDYLGFRYIEYLLLHPDKTIESKDLEAEVNPGKLPEYNVRDQVITQSDQDRFRKIITEGTLGVRESEEAGILGELTELSKTETEDMRKQLQDFDTSIMEAEEKNDFMEVERQKAIRRIFLETRHVSEYQENVSAAANRIQISIKNALEQLSKEAESPTRGLSTQERAELHDLIEYIKNTISTGSQLCYCSPQKIPWEF